MKKILLLVTLLLLNVSFVEATSTNKKIKKSEKSLDQSLRKQKEMSGQLEKIANDIEKANRDNRELNKKLQILSRQFGENEEEYQASKKILAEQDKALRDINFKIIEKNQKFIDVLANQTSVIQAMNQSHDPTRESIVMQEAYGLLKEKNTQELIALKQQIDQKKVKKRKIATNRIAIKKKINKIAMQRDEYESQIEAKEKLLEKLAIDEEKYRKRMQETIDEQNDLRSTLAQLNILQKNEVEEDRRIAAEQKATMLAEEKRKREIRKKHKQARVEARKEGKKVEYATEEKEEEAPPAKIEVTQKGTSYQQDKIYSYQGGRTISPIRGGKLIKSFGSYTDPVYKIKIFNESITLQAPSGGAKVQNVLNGKVVFAGPSSMLGNVVVVAHGGKIHTVYAGLSKIAPSIQKGSSIKTGYVIGKVSNKLIFEATKDSKHIDPLKLITL